MKDIEFHLLDTGHFALEEDLDQIGALMCDFLDRKVPKNMMLDGNLGVRQARGVSR